MITGKPSQPKVAFGQGDFWLTSTDIISASDALASYYNCYSRIITYGELGKAMLMLSHLLPITVLADRLVFIDKRSQLNDDPFQLAIGLSANRSARQVYNDLIKNARSITIDDNYELLSGDNVEIKDGEIKEIAEALGSLAFRIPCAIEFIMEL